MPHSSVGEEDEEDEDDSPNDGRTLIDGGSESLWTVGWASPPLWPAWRRPAYLYQNLPMSYLRYPAAVPLE